MYLNTTLLAADRDLLQKYDKFITEDFHPCVMAKSVFANQQIDFHSYQKMGDESVSRQILSDLDKYLVTAQAKEKEFYSFIAAFPEMTFENEVDFDTLFWQQLQMLHNLDTSKWDSAVSSDTRSKDFSFSLRGTAFYVIGLHPNSSRMSRQSPCPTIVFNLHNQFEQLREMGVYDSVKNRIRRRDKKLQGSINPVLADFGQSSEARQYSGKAHDNSWKCPFLAQNK